MISQHMRPRGRMLPIEELAQIAEAADWPGSLSECLDRLEALVVVHAGDDVNRC